MAAMDKLISQVLESLGGYDLKKFALVSASRSYNDSIDVWIAACEDAGMVLTDEQKAKLREINPEDGAAEE